jgi:hypothetical protein
MSRVASVIALLAAWPSFAGGPVPGFNTATPYLVYYGNWDSTKVNVARNHYRLVILHPSSNVTAANVASIRRGVDNVAGTADDVLVLAYISIGEDDRPGAPFVGDGQGPRVDPRASDSEPLSSITNVIGAPSPGGTGYASYYLDTKTSANGLPDQNSIFGGYYVNAGDPAWWNILKTMTKLSNGRAGLDEILTATNGVSYDCDGVFLDTIDTAAPNSFGGTTFEWTAPGMQALVHRISTNYPGKVLMGNRGLFFFNPNLKTYAYTLRTDLNMVMFESYYTDSSNSGQATASFADNKNNYAPKLNAEAGRADGFNVVSLGYDHTPALPPEIVAQDYVESMRVQGWTLYRTDPALNSAFQTNATLWLATNADVHMPEWDSTAAQSSTPPTPRIGVQQVVPGDGAVTVRWDVARDQTWPVRYNVYYTDQPALNFATATKLAHLTPAMPANYAAGTGAGSYPYEYTVTGLSNGVAYRFAVRAEDSAVPAHEDTNTVSKAATPGSGSASGSFRRITVDGDFSDWAEVPWNYYGVSNGNTVNFAAVQFANDTNYLYCHFKLHQAAAPFSDFNTHLFLDRDFDALTGFHPSSASFGSELMIEGATGYDQRNGGFNEGVVSGTGWQLLPAGTGTEFELRLSLAAAYAGGIPVFVSNQFRVLLQDNRGSEVTGNTGIEYTLATNPPPTYAHITVDGDMADWSAVPLLATAPFTNTALSFASLRIANDNHYLYLRFKLHTNGTPFSDFNTHLFVDTDNNSATGYQPSGLSIGSELMIESGAGYDERSGIFNAGPVSGLDWLLSPAGAGTDFEVRLSRQAQFTGGVPVFTNPTIRVVLQDNRGSILIPQGVVYTFADGGPYENWRAQFFTAAEIADPAISGDVADPDGDGVVNLVEFAFNLHPRVNVIPTLPRAFVQTFSGEPYLHVEYTRRNPPADVQYLPQCSTNLFAWNGDPSNFTTVGTSDNGDGTSLVTLRKQSPLAAAVQTFVRIGILR